MRRLPWVLLPVLLFVACVQTAPSIETPTTGAVQVLPPLPPPGPTCGERCALAAELCVPFDATACDTRCDDARSRCLADAGYDCLAARRCYREAPTRPFTPGPFGTGVKDVAGPVTLPTAEGDWRLEAEWTGRDSYLFLFNSTQTAALFAGRLGPLLDASPRNVVYVFGWQGNEQGYLAAKARWQQELNLRTDQGYWSTRVVFVDQRIDLTTGWVADMMKARGASPPRYLGNSLVAFGIDRLQRIREVGMLGRLGSGGTIPDLSLLQLEARAFNLEFDREAALQAEQAQVITLATAQTAYDRLDVDATLPDPASFDTLEVDLALDCPNHLNAECGAWDYLSHLRLCAPATEADGGATWTCDRELARWITPYWREGRWVTDISAQLATLQAGPQHLRWVANGQWDPRRTNYIVTLSLRFSNRQRGMRPVSATPLWTGGDWNATYDAAKTPQTVPIPADAKKVELVALTTGHGGVAGTNCAEFCNHQHVFTINGTERRQAFPGAQTGDGCLQRVDAGVVPNQHGTWYYGRGGWCPGQDVAPWAFDVTSLVTKGQDATLTYRTELNGAAVVSGQGNIVLSSWLVVWK
jgi:hypothetical protein